MIFDVMLRLEPDPNQHDLARGWAAELADPSWLLGRQWQMGEHQGDDASSPVVVNVSARATPIGAADSQVRLDPGVVPAQAVIESEPGDWWTAGRRVRVGRAVAAAAAAHGIALVGDSAGGPLALIGLPVPYDGFTGPDGRALWHQRAELALDAAWFGTPAPPADEPVDFWDPALLSYTATLPAGEATLTVDRDGGGDLDWTAADADRDVGAAGAATTVQTIPGRLRYPSAPLPRWWQIEDAQVSIGGQAPDRAAVATLVLIDLIVNQSEDWFTFTLPATAGQVVTFDAVTVTDSFGDAWPLTPPTGWSLFATTGLPTTSLVVWATARTPLAGPTLDRVAIGIDEDSDLVWAVEQVVGGRTLATSDPPVAAPPVQTDSAAQATYSYLPMTPIPQYWHPYVVEEVDGKRRFVQGRAADLSGPTPTLLPPPISDLLYDPNGGHGRPMHQLDPAAIPAEGLRIERRAMLARTTAGEPVLWTQRRRDVLVAPPTFALRFDVLDQVAAAESEIDPPDA